MLYNYLKIAWRNLIRSKVFSAINLLGLAIGMAACILILHHVSFELSYDSFHKDTDTLYRLGEDNPKMGYKTSTFPAAVGPDIKAAFPEVKEILRLYPRRGILSYSGGDKIISFKEHDYTYSDPSFPDLLSFEGIEKGALDIPYSLLMSKSKAKKYFGEENPIGKVLTLYDDFGQVNYTVQGVYPDFPMNSQLQYDVIFSFSRLDELMKDGGGPAQWGIFMTYMKLNPGADIPALETKINEAARQQYGEVFTNELFLQPFMDVYLHSDFVYDKVEKGDAKKVGLLALLAGFILLLAWVNYINLTTARSLDRAREVGIRKVLGAWRGQLVGQFLLESILINVLAFILAVVLAEVSLPFVFQFAGMDMNVSWRAMELEWWVLLSVFFLIGAVIAGLYPSLILSKFQTARVLKSRFVPKSGSQWMRKGLVVFQFAVSISLLIGTMAVFSQMKYMQSRDLGIDVDQTFVLEGPEVGDSTLSMKMEVLKQTLNTLPGISEMTASGAIPGMYTQYMTHIKPGDEAPGKEKTGQIAHVQAGFFEFYGMKTLKGKVFSPDKTTDLKGVVVTKAVLKTLGYSMDDPEIFSKGITLGDNESSTPIIGIVNDFQHNGPESSFTPMIFENKPGNNGFLSLRVTTTSGNLPELLQTIEDTYTSILPGNPFNGVFLDQVFENQYESDRQSAKTFTLFAVLAIIIATMGLLGLSVYTTLQRTKEIGIRKVLGANVSDLIVLLSSDFMKLVGIACVVALPLASYGIFKWLEGYAFKMPISPLIFLIPIALVVLIASLTVSLQTLRAAKANPVEALRWE